MAIVFKKALRKNVADQTAAAKYYPQLLTLGQSVGIDKIAYQIVRGFSFHFSCSFLSFNSLSA